MRVSSVMRAVLDRDVEIDAHEHALARRARDSLERSSMPVTASVRSTGARATSFFSRSTQRLRVAPLVVVPGHHLDEVAVHHLGVGGVDDRRVRVAAEVDRHQRLGRRTAGCPSAAPSAAALSAALTSSAGRLLVEPARRDRPPRRSASARASRCRRACPSAPASPRRRPWPRRSSSE